jgi:hypothetical protein
MNEKEALQKGADEARKVARAGREFAGFLDEYAKYLTQPTWRERADELHTAALNKLNVISDGLAACKKWVEESGKIALVEPSEQSIKSEVRERQELPEISKPRGVMVRKKGSSR